MRKVLVVIAMVLPLLGAVLVDSAPAEASRPKQQAPSEIALPEGFFPEGIAIGRGATFYVGSLADGSIYKGNLRTGEGAVLSEPTGPFSTVGLTVDRWGRVWVAGGPTGVGRVHDGKTGELLATFELTAPFESFINDVVFTRRAAWFTDSGTQNSPDPANFQFAGTPRIFKVPLDRRGALPGQDAVEEIPVAVPDVAFPNLNGIERAPRGRDLVVAHTSVGALFNVDPSDGSADQIEIGVELAGADGLVRRGSTIYVVENAAAQITAVRLRGRSNTGKVTGVFPVDGAETPTTAARFGSALYVADARFQSQTGPYEIFRVPLRRW